MNKSQPSPKTNFAWIGIAVIVAAGFCVALVSPVLIRHWHKQAADLGGQADRIWQSDPGQAIADLYVASYLDPGNHQYSQTLADRLLDQNKPDQAVAVLRRLPAGESGFRIAQIQFQMGQFKDSLKTLQQLPVGQAGALRSFDYLEMGESDVAITSAKQAFIAEPSTDNAMAYGLALAGSGKSDEINTLSTQAPATLKVQLQAIQTSTLKLAETLYAKGLSKTAARLLQDHLDTDGACRLAVQIVLSNPKPSKASLQQARQAADKGLELNPADTQLHHLSQNIADLMKDKTRSAKEAEQIKVLETGRV